MHVCIYVSPEMCIYLINLLTRKWKVIARLLVTLQLPRHFVVATRGEVQQEPEETGKLSDSLRRPSPGPLENPRIV